MVLIHYLDVEFEVGVKEDKDSKDLKALNLRAMLQKDQSQHFAINFKDIVNSLLKFKDFKAFLNFKF